MGCKNVIKLGSRAPTGSYFTTAVVCFYRRNEGKWETKRHRGISVTVTTKEAAWSKETRGRKNM